MKAFYFNLIFATIFNTLSYSSQIEMKLSPSSEGEIYIDRILLTEVDLIDFAFRLNSALISLGNNESKIIREIRIRDPLPVVSPKPFIFKFDYNFDSEEEFPGLDNKIPPEGHPKSLILLSCNVQKIEYTQFLEFLSEFSGLSIIKTEGGLILGSEELLFDHPGLQRYTFKFSKYESRIQLKGLPDKMSQVGPAIAFNFQSGLLTVIAGRDDFLIFDSIFSQLDGEFLDIEGEL
jgi:hypothetical protein